MRLRIFAVAVLIACLATARADVPDVTVTAPRPPTDQEVAGESLFQFIVHHATVRHVDFGNTHDLAYWRGGKQSICPRTVGLSRGYDAFVTARLRALAAYVGAPVQSDLQCKTNVQIRFTNDPEAAMNAVFKWATHYFRNRYSGGVKNLIAFKSDHPVQGWYMTTRGGSTVLNTDASLLRLDVLPVWPQVVQNGIVNTAGGSGIGIVILIVDKTKVVGDTIGTISDYLAMLTLSVAQSPDHCDALPSILDLMSSSCSTRDAPTAMTAGDLAFLKALYYGNPGGLTRSRSPSDIQGDMLRQFKHP